MAVKSCGQRGMCSKLVAIAEIGRPADRWRPSFTGGCGISASHLTCAIVARDLDQPVSV